MPRELEELAEGAHRYREYRVWGLRIVLCDFCDADFGSYFPSHFGFKAEDRARLDDLEFLREVEPSSAPDYDKYCPKCQHRLAFLNFRRAAIDLNEKNDN